MEMINQINSYEHADIVVFGAPYDETVTFKSGAVDGPAAIRQCFYGVESFSPYQNCDLSDVRLYDAGDINLQTASPEYMVDLVEETVDDILADGKIPFMLGGEHLVTLGAVRAVCKKYNDLHIVHFDAHADLAEQYDGQLYSHACIMKRCYDLLGDKRIWQFGIRSMSKGEFDFIKDKHVTTEMFDVKNVSKMQFSKKAPVYLTVDLDVLNPSEFPGTGTQEAGGISFNQLLKSLKYVFQHYNVVGVDNVELAPTIDPTGKSTMLACKLLREELIALRKTSKT